ncbi:hypothetical protein OsJ_12256 [Oryza sativa Japonica Group]|uniref:Uncharacterized protein n=1 Tax=Oryza sativa subsp. japonica TaxID=39947 RepID=B9FAT2_ORYSJ|nr:hypothetical protein OsJ_12256 [Oryza sativa Japonica Group]
MHEIGENPIRPLAAGARGVEERGERRGEPVERLPVKLELVERDVAGGLGAVGEPVDARQWERHEVDELCQLGANRREAGEVARGGDEGHAVAARGEALGRGQGRGAGGPRPSPGKITTFNGDCEEWASSIFGRGAPVSTQASAFF